MSGSTGPKFDAEGVRDHLGNRQSWLSYSFGIAAIVFVAIDLFADHQAGQELRQSSASCSGC
jgi:hypothetical protein